MIVDYRVALVISERMIDAFDFSLRLDWRLLPEASSPFNTNPQVFATAQIVSIALLGLLIFFE